MVKDCPTSVAIDHKKTGFLTEDLIKNLTPDEANVLWDFAVHFVLLDVLRVIADTHCVFPVTRDMLNSLANAPFVYADQGSTNRTGFLFVNIKKYYYLSKFFL